ncbi:MAG TPA: TIGR03086 family metal-binding protein [Acidimicrobiales bacterium]|jgi:uncharacterized protein (TIGR03086 family)|nr:TIGR03086 family metal-binding protein [Acidimicrobiales bacterium]
MLDLTPATTRMAALLDAIDTGQFSAPTPCPAADVGYLVDHVRSLSVVFAAAARKDREALAGPPPMPDQGNLGDDWREQSLTALGALAQAWSEPGAWEGLTLIAGLDLPGEVAGLIALDELVVHGWDLAVSLGLPYEPLPAHVEAAAAMVVGFEAPRDGQLFGPIVDVPDTASPFAKLLGLTGRDPAWSPPG